MKLKVVVDRPDEYLDYNMKFIRFMERRWRTLEAAERVSVEIVGEGCY